MPKPNVYIINKGGMGAGSPESNLGEGAYSCNTTVGLVEYEKDGAKKYMLVDTSLVADWDNILKGLEEHGQKQDVTHILVTHWDQDHMQNIKEFPGALVISGAGTARIGTKDFGGIEALYPNGYIENENIKFQNINRTHSRDEMIFIIDSENEGKVAFVGDLIFAPLSEVPAEQAVMFDKGFTIDIAKQYLVLKELFEGEPDIQKLFVGHSATPITREEFASVLKAMESPVYQEAIKELVQDLEEKADRYRKLL